MNFVKIRNIYCALLVEIKAQDSIQVASEWRSFLWTKSDGT